MTWQALNLAAPDYAEPSEPPTTCGLVYRRKRIAISGAPETLKTMLVLIFALEEMRAGGVVAFIDFESGPAETRRLLEDLGATEQELGSVVYFEPDRPPCAEDVDYIAAQGATLAIIDAAAGAYSVSDLDDNKRADAEKFARAWVQPLWQQEIATIILDHVTKAVESRGRYAIGSERKLGQVDVHLGLEVVGAPLTRGTTGLVKVRVHKDRPGHLSRPYAAEVELVSDSLTHRITWTIRQAVTTSSSENGWKPTVLMQRVSEHLAQHPDGLSRNAIEKAVRGKSNEYKRQAIDELIAGGYAIEETGAHRARIVKFVLPFTSPSTPDFAATSPGEDGSDFAQFARPLQGGELRGEVDEVERVAQLAREAGT